MLGVGHKKHDTLTDYGILIDFEVLTNSHDYLFDQASSSFFIMIWNVGVVMMLE